MTTTILPTAIARVSCTCPESDYRDRMGNPCRCTEYITLKGLETFARMGIEFDGRHYGCTRH